MECTMPLAGSVYNTSGDEINDVPITYRHARTVTRPGDIGGLGSFSGPFHIARGGIAYPPDVARTQQADRRIARWQRRPHLSTHVQRAEVLRSMKAAAEMLMIAGGELSLDVHLRAAMLAEAHRVQTILFTCGVMLCRRFEQDAAIWKEPLLGVSADA
jgi:hypothetical protein